MQFRIVLAASVSVLSIAASSRAVVYTASGGPLVDEGVSEFPLPVAGTGRVIGGINSVTLTGLNHTKVGALTIAFAPASFDPNVDPFGTLMSFSLSSAPDSQNADLGGTYVFVGDTSLPSLAEAAVGLGTTQVVPAGTYAAASFLDTITPGPKRDFANYAGLALDQTWKLVVQDWSENDTGTLESFSVDFAVTAIPEPALLGSLAMAGLLATRPRA